MANQILTYTDTTCGPACWEAKEETCRCSCAGANHGIMTHGGDQPQRSKKFDGRRYVLAGIAIGYGNAMHECHAHNVHRPGDRHAAMHIQPAPRSSFGKWPELAAYQPSDFFQEHPYLIWQAA